MKTTVLKAVRPTRVGLFAVGNGGDPGRHLPLLTSLSEQGCTVVAPHFERLASPRPTEEELLLRARGLRLALDEVALPDLPVVGIGHSIGATMLIALAGGQIWLGPGQRLSISPDSRLSRLVLLAPATGFFQAPAALDAVHTPILAWVGSDDLITPPAQAQILKDRIQSPVEVRIVEGAGHFSFMSTPPPQTSDSLPDREAFLAELAREIGRFSRSENAAT